jgi:hypothetical protein
MERTAGGTGGMDRRNHCATDRLSDFAFTSTAISGGSPLLSQTPSPLGRGAAFSWRPRSILSWWSPAASLHGVPGRLGCRCTFSIAWRAAARSVGESRPSRWLRLQRYQDLF